MKRTRLPVRIGEVPITDMYGHCRGCLQLRIVQHIMFGPGAHTYLSGPILCSQDEWLYSEMKQRLLVEVTDEDQSEPFARRSELNKL